MILQRNSVQVLPSSIVSSELLWRYIAFIDHTAVIAWRRESIYRELAILLERRHDVGKMYLLFREF